MSSYFPSTTSHGTLFGLRIICLILSAATIIVCSIGLFNYVGIALVRESAKFPPQTLSWISWLTWCRLVCCCYSLVTNTHGLSSNQKTASPWCLGRIGSNRRGDQHCSRNHPACSHHHLHQLLLRWGLLFGSLVNSGIITTSHYWVSCAVAMKW